MIHSQKGWDSVNYPVYLRYTQTERHIMRVKIQWSFLYENETTEDIEYEDGDNFKDLLSHLAPNELGECVDGWISSVEDEEGNVLYEC